MKDYSETERLERKMLPDYPRTRHLPWNPNATRDDLIATEDEASIIFSGANVYVEEKVDGANVGIALGLHGPIIRNRNHILHKGYTARTAAKKQFAPIWNWFYDNETCFRNLEDMAGPVSVYGEWLCALHSVSYDQLSSYFMAFDLYNFEKGQYMDPCIGRNYLQRAGFNIVPLLHVGPLDSYKQLEKLVQEPSPFSSTDKREGVYVKVGDGRYITHRFKMVRQGFIAGEHFSTRADIVKNKLLK